MSGVVTQNISGNSGLVKAVEAGGGTWVEIKTLTSDGSDATMSFVNGTSDVVLVSTYPIYCFRFIGIHPETDDAEFTFNLSVDTGSNYNVTKTSNLFRAQHGEGDEEADLLYTAGQDIAQGTGFQIMSSIGNDNDQNLSGVLYLFSPSSTTFVKHYIFKVHSCRASSYTETQYSSGIGNTTSAVDAVQFKMSSDEIQSGKIKLFGLKDS